MGKTKTIPRVAGELILIVVGVLIALAADQHAEERSLRAVQADFLRALLAETDDLMGQFDNNLRYWEEAEEATRFLADWIGSDSPAPAGDTLGLALYRAGRELLPPPVWSAGRGRHGEPPSTSAG